MTPAVIGIIAASFSATAAVLSGMTLWILSDLRDRIKRQEEKCDRRIEEGVCHA